SSIEPGRGGEARGKLLPCEKLTMTQVRGRWMIGGEAAGDALQLFAPERPDAPSKRRRFDNRLEAPRAGSDVLAYRVQLRRVGRVQPTTDPHPGRRDLEIQTS